uniref:Uncharacterized protein n=1 Tax=Panagrolaimus sp. ES5 TaxID=591445 RepID=A0AC34FRM2_9BILA
MPILLSNCFTAESEGSIAAAGAAFSFFLLNFFNNGIASIPPKLGVLKILLEEEEEDCEAAAAAAVFAADKEEEEVAVAVAVVLVVAAAAVVVVVVGAPGGVGSICRRQKGNTHEILSPLAFFA